MKQKFFKIEKKVYHFFSKIYYNINLIKYKDSINIIDSIDNTRLPKDLERSKKIKINNKYLASKYIIIKTNSKSISGIVTYSSIEVLNHMSLEACAGIDVYAKYKQNIIWLKTLFPQNCFSLYSNFTIELTKEIEEIYFYLPSFASIDELRLKTNDKNTINIIEDNRENIVIYGSSISQGCAASRPALSYCNLLNRKLNKKIINFGFSESAHGDDIIIDYISNINTNIFIIEYDHNSNLEEFEERHIKIYNKIRKNNLNCMIIFLSRLSGGLSISLEEEEKRINTIQKTVDFAHKNGDYRVFFINGRNILDSIDKDLYFVDDRHPNDLGMNLLATKIIDLIKEEENSNDK